MIQKSHTAKLAYFRQNESLKIFENSFASCTALDITTIQIIVHLNFSKELLKVTGTEFEEHRSFGLGTINCIYVWRDGIKKTEA